MPVPALLYSSFVITICRKWVSEESMEPPTQTAYLRSSGATTLTFIVGGARVMTSFLIRPRGLGHHSSSRENDVGVEVLTDIDIALHDRVEQRLVDAAVNSANKFLLKDDRFTTFSKNYYYFLHFFLA
jgi:hypothetical protein